MPRYPHQLGKRDRRHWPYRILCVDTTEIDQSEVDARGRHTPQLADWHMVGLLSKGGDYEYRPVESSGTAVDFWRIIESYSLQHKRLVIVSYNTSLVWTLLGMWERLESGDIWLEPREWATTDRTSWAISILSQDGASPRKSYSAGRIRRLIEGAIGYIVLSGSPLLLKCHVMSSENWVTWVDISNYGVSRPSEVSAGARTCDWLADTMCRIRRMDNECRRSGWAATAGGLAEQWWRHGYYAGAASITVHPGALSTETSAYYGGRAEAFHTGHVKYPIWYLDIRNCYAYMCARTAVPIRLRRAVSIVDAMPSGGIRGCGSWTATVQVRTETPLYPYRMGEIVVWPVGTFTTSLCGPELYMAHTRGHILEWHEAYEYDCELALRDYALALYAARCVADNRGDTEISAVAKMMLNCLVGRLAQRDTNWQPARDIDCDILWGEYDRLDEHGSISKYRSLGGRIQKLCDNGYVQDAMPAMAGWITSAARCYLAQLAECAGWTNVLYMDTDALMVTRDGFDRLRDGGYYREHELGLLGCRWKADLLTIYGVKHYIHDGIPVCSGVPAGAYDELISAAIYRHQRTATESLRLHQRPSSDTIVRRTHLPGEYRHGVVGADGRITSHRIGE